MEDSSPAEYDIDILFDHPHYDHERAAYFIPERGDNSDTVAINWPLREEWGVETKQRCRFKPHYKEFCEPVPEAVFNDPLQVILQFAFNEYETLRTRLGGGHEYELPTVDRVSDLGVALRLMQKETDTSFDRPELEDQ